MKSLYYTAVVTRAYRKHLDALSGTAPADLAEYRDDLFKVSHREYCTGFFFGRGEIDRPTESDYREHHVFLGTVGRETRPGVYALDIRNRITAGSPVEYIGPDLLRARDEAFTLLDESGRPLDKADHGHTVFLKPGLPVREGFILRRPRSGAD